LIDDFPCCANQAISGLPVLLVVSSLSLVSFIDIKTFFRVFNVFLFFKRFLFLKKRWQSSERQAD